MWCDTMTEKYHQNRTNNALFVQKITLICKKIYKISNNNASGETEATVKATKGGFHFGKLVKINGIDCYLKFCL